MADSNQHRKNNEHKDKPFSSQEKNLPDSSSQDEDNIDEKPSYLDIFTRPSFRDVRQKFSSSSNEPPLNLQTKIPRGMGGMKQAPQKI